MATFVMLVSGSTVDEWQIGPGGTSLTEAVRVTGDGKYVYAVDPPDDMAYRLQLWNSNSTRPADLNAGATINSVKLSAYASNYGVASESGNYDVWARIGGTNAFTSVGGSVNLTYDRDLPRPGGGSWVYTDFDSSLYFGLRHRANATAGTMYAATFGYVNVVVDYTPAAVTPPTAEFGVSTTTGSAPLTVNFTDSSTQTPTSWAWAFGDTATSSDQNPSHAYTTVGTYTVTLTATNAGGSDSEVKSSLINVQTAATAVSAAFTGSPLTGVQNLGVQFYDGSTGTPAPSSWSWAFGDTATSTSQNPSHTYTTVGTYTVTLTVSNTTPTTSTVTKTNYVSVASGLPTPTITLNTTNGPVPLTIVATGTATNGDSASWSWTFGDGNGSIVQNPTHVFTSVGTYTITLVAANAIGTASSTKAVTVTYSIPTAAFTAENLVGYSPLTVRFTDLSEGAGSWLWSFGDTYTSTAQNPVHTYTSTGAKTVTLTVDPVDATETTSPFLASVTSTNLVCNAQPSNSWGLFLYELKHILMENTDGQNLVEGFTDFGGIAQVVKLIQQRLKKFVLNSAALRKEATLSAAAANSESFPLPSDLIELLRVEVNGTAYYPADQFQLDADSAGLNQYIRDDTLSITIPGTFGTTPTVKVWYSYVPDAPATPSYSCPGTEFAPWGFFPLPYVLWWIIKYGVLADMFSQAGEKNDPIRAAKCEELFTEGTEIYKTLYRGEA